MLLALPGLAREGFDVNARGCRQYPEALALLSVLEHAHQLPHMVVIALGANGSIEPSEIAQVLRILGRGRILVLLTPRELGGGSGADAQLVRAEGRRHSANIVVLDWVAYSAAHPDWFEPDGLHVNPTGAAGMIRLIARVLPLAQAPHAIAPPTCRPARETSPPAGAAEPLPPGDGPPPALDVKAPASVLLVDPRTRRLQVPVGNPGSDPIGGLATLETDGPGRHVLVAAACFTVPADGHAQLEIPVSRAVSAGAELFARAKMRVLLQVSRSVYRTAGSYIIRAGKD